jgi:hypothetical protein
MTPTKKRGATRATPGKIASFANVEPWRNKSQCPHNSNDDRVSLREVLREAAVRHGFSLNQLTVLAPQNDPYRRDTGYCYRNDNKCWEYLANGASKAARWLGYVPFDRIIDERNAPPEIYVPEKAPPPYIGLLQGLPVTLPPDLSAALPRLALIGGETRQSYRIVLIGEKSSLSPVLQPIAERVEGELLLPTWEVSDSPVLWATHAVLCHTAYGSKWNQFQGGLWAAYALITSPLLSRLDTLPSRKRTNSMRPQCSRFFQSRSMASGFSSGGRADGRFVCSNRAAREAAIFSGNNRSPFKRTKAKIYEYARNRRLGHCS